MCRFPKAIGVSTIGAPVHYSGTDKLDTRWRGVLISHDYRYSDFYRNGCYNVCRVPKDNLWHVGAADRMMLYTGWDLT